MYSLQHLWPSRQAERIRRALACPYAALWIAAVALALMAPALFTGLVLDDYAQLAMLRRDGLMPEFVRAPWDLYSFMLNDTAWRAALMAKGTLPWFIDPEIHATFWRPLSSLTLYLDHLLWPQSVVMRHVHSFVWYAALVFAVSRIHRRVLSTPWVAGLATLMYAVDDAHGFPTAWTANRAALIATTFGALSVWLHMRWRESGRSFDGLAAPALLAIGLLGGESALCLPAYTLAYALVLDRGRLAERALSLLPTAAVLLAWRIAYVRLGYGVGGSELYIDPATDPLHFAAAAVARLPAMLLGQLTPVPSELHFFVSSPARIGVSLLGAAVVLGIAWRCRALLRDSASARFATVGMVLATVPVLSTFPNNRLLFGAGVGAFAFVAELLGCAFPRSVPAAEAPPAAPVSRALAVFFAVTHLVLAPLFLPLNAYGPQFFANCYDTATSTFDRAGPLTGKTLVIVNGPDFFFTSWPPLFRAEKGLSYPAAVRVLGTTLTAVDVTRVDQRTLLLHPDDGYLNSPLDPLLRRASRPFHAGDTFDYGDVLILVESVTPDGRPAVIRCTFRDGLDATRYRWTAWWPDGYRAFELPALGETTRLPAFTPRDLVHIGMNGP